LNYQGCPEFFIHVPGSTFKENKAWYYNFEFAVEQYRGLDFKEDLYTHGKFSVELKKGDKLGVVISMNEPRGRNALEIFENEKKRRIKVVEEFSSNESLKRLALAADQFVVKRGDLKTVIAGYHWFSDWGRDTMIALPGLCLVTGRFDDAKNILQAFAESVSDGMLPNRFPDNGEAPEYNTVDATLWFFHAIYKYYQYTFDTKFIHKLIPVLKDIIEWHYKGTRYNIHVDRTDELLFAGSEGVQLTWMDARVGDWVVTPRVGKPVEINALWYNALCIMNYLLKELSSGDEGNTYLEKSKKVRKNFQEQFWNKKQNCLYDFVNGGEKNDDLRPNQIYAIALPFPLLEKTRSEEVLKIVSERLLTPSGLRSLFHDHKDYHPVYGGDQWHRDSAYHQGTVWSFLLGPYIDALVNVKGAVGKAEATKILSVFFKHLDEAGIGSVSEIFDAEPPHTSRGCIAQAWGVGEVLRVAKEHQIF
jgi:predicted glycogen debranching enzyme